MDLPFHADLIDHALEREQRSLAWDLWSQKYWKMSAENFQPFDDFVAEAFHKEGRGFRAELKDWEDIEGEMGMVVAAYEAKKAVR